LNGHLTFLGLFKTVEEAARAFARAYRYPQKAQAPSASDQNEDEDDEEEASSSSRPAKRARVASYKSETAG
jgi:hypothetical protein